MRIALVIERFEPRGGGVEAVAWTVAHELARVGEQVHVFARTAAPGAAEALRVRALGGPRRWQPARVLAFSRAAAAAAPRDAYDVVQSFSRTRHQDVFRAGGGCHAAYMERAYGRAGAAWRRLTPRHATLLALERAVFADASQLVLCSAARVRDEIRARYPVAPERFAILPNGVDVRRFHPGLRAASRGLRAELAPGARRIWLLVGSGFRRKGVDTALRVLALRGGDAEVLWVAGADAPAPWRALAAELGVADRVRFLGRRDDLPALYGAADALLLPTRYDAFANVCLEAAACGLPVVTSGANGAADWLGDVGCVVEDPEDVAGFAAALGGLEDEGRRHDLGEAARRRAEASTWAHHVESLRALYRRVRR